MERGPVAPAPASPLLSPVPGPFAHTIVPGANVHSHTWRGGRDASTIKSAPPAPFLSSVDSPSHHHLLSFLKGPNGQYYSAQTMCHEKCVKTGAGIGVRARDVYRREATRILICTARGGCDRRKVPEGCWCFSGLKFQVSNWSRRRSGTFLLPPFSASLREKSGTSELQFRI